MIKRLAPFFITLIGLTLSFNLSAATIKKVKGKKALIILEDTLASPGEHFYALDGNDKRKAIITIKKVRGQKAIGTVRKGKARAGYRLVPRKSKKKKKAVASKNPFVSEGTEASMSTQKGQKYWGVLLGMGMDSMDASIADTNGNLVGNTSMSGTSFSLKGLFDYALWDKIWFRGSAGLQNFNVESSDSFCGTTNTAKCISELSYLSIDLWGRLAIAQMTNMNLWLGGGVSLLFPMSKSTTALDEASITSTSTFGLGGGVDWFLKPGMYIPIQIEYGFFPKSNDVEASYINIRGGAAWTF